MESRESMVLTDEQIIKKADPRVRGRIHIELQIVNKFIETAKATGYELVIAAMDEEDLAEHGNDFKTLLFDLDDAHVNVFDGEKRVGWVRFVFGNDGYDCISDYSTALEEFLKPVNDLASWWGD